MNSAIKSTIAAAVLALASAVAVAAPTVPAQPATGPIPVPSSGNGGLVFYAFDATAQRSLTLWLGLNLNDVLPSNMDANLSFGVLSGWNTAFGSSSASNIRWWVAATDNGATSNPSNFSNYSFAFTSADDPTGNLSNQAMRGAMGNIENYFVGPSGAGVGTNPILANSSLVPQWTGRLGTTVTDDAGAGAVNFVVATNHSNAGSELQFWYAQGANNTLGARQTVITPYLGTWVLAANGLLTYELPGAPIPLPAAAWLLLSGLAGLGAVARRRNQEAA